MVSLYDAISLYVFLLQGLQLDWDEIEFEM